MLILFIAYSLRAGESLILFSKILQTFILPNCGSLLFTKLRSGFGFCKTFCRTTELRQVELPVPDSRLLRCNQECLILFSILLFLFLASHRRVFSTHTAAGE